MPTLHIGSRSSEELIPKVKGCTFIVMGDAQTMGEEHNVVFGQGPRVNRAKSTLTSSSICLMRHMEGEVGVLLALLTLGPCPKTTLCSSPIALAQCHKTKLRIPF